VQAVGSLPAVALLERVARAVPLPPSPELVVIADYGSSEGHNSLRPIAATRPRAVHLPNKRRKIGEGFLRCVAASFVQAPD
jgi:hypothetical protein